MSNSEKIIEISKNLGLAHIGSCLSVLPILERIYREKQKEDLVILDNAHAHVAHLVVSIFSNHEELIKKYGIHCERLAGCDASGGSLGHAIGIGIGMALSNSKRTVYVVVSDGSMQEGSNWEALRIASELNLRNIVIFCNFNRYTAVAEIDPEELYMRMQRYKGEGGPYILLGADNRITKNSEGFEGVQGHYKKI